MAEIFCGSSLEDSRVMTMIKVTATTMTTRVTIMIATSKTLASRVFNLDGRIFFGKFLGRFQSHDNGKGDNNNNDNKSDNNDNNNNKDTNFYSFQSRWLNFFGSSWMVPE